jgi:hypothetical protein
MRYLTLIFILAIFGSFYMSCASSDNDEPFVDDTGELALELLAARDSINPWDVTHDSMPDDNCVRLHTNVPRMPLARLFNDSNYIQYAAARELGIDPITDDSKAWNLKRPLVHIVSCPQYYVAELTHSYAYLVPEAAQLLKEVGDSFNIEQKRRGGGNYRLKVTSLLRTPQTVKRLRRVNRCATDSSAHQFATTFDISYARFMCDSFTVHRTQEDLKNLLAEVLYNFREQGRCYIKYERKSGCFHVTTRK